MHTLHLFAFHIPALPLRLIVKNRSKIVQACALIHVLYNENIMRIVIECLLKNPVKEYQWSLVNQVAERFPELNYTKEQALEAHFTLKYPFEIEDVASLEKTILDFARTHKKTPVTIGGFDHFDDRVAFVKVELSKEAKNVFEAFIDALKDDPEISWEPIDGKDLHFHVTIAERCGVLCSAVLEFVKGKERRFDTYFDNISILKYTDKTSNGISKWEHYRTFDFS